MNFLDAFVVSIGMDRRPYKAGAEEQTADNKRLRDDTKKTADEIEKLRRRQSEAEARADRERFNQQKQLQQSLDATKRQAVETFAVLVGANSVRSYIANTVSMASATQRMSIAAGVATQDMSAFGMMIERNGGSAETAKQSIAGLARAMELWRTLGQVSPEMNAAFTQIGANPNDSPIEVYEKYAAWAKGRDPRLVSQTGAMLGFDEASINQAMKGRSEVEKALDQSRRLGALNDAQAAKLRALQQSWQNLTQSIKGNALEMLTDAAPAMETVLGSVDRLVEKFPLLTKLVLGLGVAWTGVSGLKVGLNILKLLGLGGGGAGAGEAAAGVVGAGETVAGGAGAAALAIPAAIVGTIAYAVHPSGGQTGEDARMRQRIGAWRGGGQQRRDQAIAYFKSQGWSDDEARGIAAGIQAENGGFNPDASNPTSGAYGLNQALGGRQKLFRQVFGRDIHGSSFEDQLAFIQYELTHTERGAASRIRGHNASDAAYAYLAYYERPGPGLGGDVRRANHALSQQVSVGTVNIQTQATDAKGIAQDFRRQMAATGYAAQANSGLD